MLTISFARVLGITTLALSFLWGLGGCSSTIIKPAPLVKFTPTLNLPQVWRASVGKDGGNYFIPLFVDGFLYAAGKNGEVAKFEAKTGREIWRTDLKINLTVGVTGDAKNILVAGEQGFLIALDQNGKEKWRRQLSSEILSLPGLARDTVVAQTIDNRLSGYDVSSGRRLWIIQRSLPSLLLRDSRGVLSSGSIAFVSFPDSKLLAVSSNNGSILWESKIVETTGSNELERLTAIVGTPISVGENICMGTYQGAIFCIDGLSGNVVWKKPFSTNSAVGGDGQYLFASDERGVAYAFITNTGLNLWQNDKMKDRQLSAAVTFGKAVAYGDFEGYVHLLSREDGSFLSRLETHSSGVASMILADKILIVQTHNGNLYAYNTQP